MDAISYSYADKQAKRIKKFINDPDSTSGVLTVPKVIASGESVTIPAGRVAILPDVQVDGTLNVLGDIFIPTGTANSKVVQKVASTDNVIVRFNGTTGDVQNSGVTIDDNNQLILGSTDISSVWTNGSLGFHNTVGTTIRGKAGSVFDLSLYNADGTSAILSHTPAGVVALSDGKLNIDSAGNVGIGTIPSAWYAGVKAQQVGTQGSIFQDQNNNVGIGKNTYKSGATIYNYTTNDYASLYYQSQGQHQWYIAPSGTAGSVITWTNAMTLGSNGNLLIGTSVDNGVDKLQVNGSITSLSNLVADSFITGTFSAGVWYNTGITSNTVYASDFSTLFGINIFEDSYNTLSNNWQNVHTFITGPYQNGITNSTNALPLNIVSRTGHACDGGTLSMRWLNQVGHVAAVLQFSLSAGGTFDSTAGKTLRIKIKKIN